MKLKVLTFPLFPFYSLLMMTQGTSPALHPATRSYHTGRLPWWGYTGPTRQQREQAPGGKLSQSPTSSWYILLGRGLHPHECSRTHPYFPSNSVNSHCAAPAEVQSESLRFSFIPPRATIVLELCWIRRHMEVRVLVRCSGQRGWGTRKPGCSLGTTAHSKYRLLFLSPAPGTENGWITGRILVPKTWVRQLASHPCNKRGLGLFPLECGFSFEEFIF